MVRDSGLVFRVLGPKYLIHWELCHSSIERSGGIFSLKSRRGQLMQDASRAPVTLRAMGLWWFPKIAGTFFGRVPIRFIVFWVSGLGSLCFGKLKLPCEVYIFLPEHC